MAAAYWHLLIGKKAIESLEQKRLDSGHFACINNYPLVFLGGIQGPDINYFPGGDKAVSSLAHYGRPADLGRNLLSLAETHEERAYALGWLMHLTTDVITHPLVNRMILQRFSRECKNGMDPDAYPLGHHRVEWGIDVYMLRNRNIAAGLPDLDEVLNAVRHLHAFVSKAFLSSYDHRLHEKTWQGAIDGMIKYVGIFRRAWRLTGRLDEDPPGTQLLKNLFYRTVALPFFNIAALRSPQNGVGAFIPVLPGAKDVEEVLSYTEKVRQTFLDYLADDFRRLVNRTA
ncbi:MAG: hypothetical protein C0394_11020 [Syntrophus sp. (in: bacteria)]|nr:hypothetical protein [Syntrophus sp. (in: bacteria)]